MFDFGGKSGSVECLWQTRTEPAADSTPPINEKSLEPLGMEINGQKARPKDAAFLRESLRQYFGIKS